MQNKLFHNDFNLDDYQVDMEKLKDGSSYTFHIKGTRDIKPY